MAYYKNDYSISVAIRDEKCELWLNQESYDDFFKEVGAANPPKEHFEYIRENNGEFIIAHSHDLIYGWAGLLPKGDRYELAGIEVNRKFRNQGIGKCLINSSKEYILSKGISLLEFQTTPLFTSNALLYVHENRSSYKYCSGLFLDENQGIPWPYVNCLIDAKKSKSIPYPKNIICVLEWNALDEIKRNYYNETEHQYVKIEMKYCDAREMPQGVKMYDFLKAYDLVFKELDIKSYEIIDFIKEDNKYYYIYRR